MRRLVLAWLIGLGTFFGTDAALFRTNLYPSVLEPDSAAGQFELNLFREREFLKRNRGNLIATLGDSRFAYAPRLANELTPKTGLVFRQAGIAGSNPRTWYYMMRDLDPTARRYRAIVIGVPRFDDEDEPVNQANDGRDLHYLLARLRWTDTLEFARSFDDWHLRWLAFRGSLLKGFLLQQDIAAFLKAPIKRIQYVQQCHRDFEFWTYNFEETERSMAGVAMDWTTGKYKLPPGADSNQKSTVEVALNGRSFPRTGRLAAFRRLWLGRLLDRYRNSPTTIIFVRLPRGPVPPPDEPLPANISTIHEFARRPNVLLCPDHAFDSLERPELFKDALHLNRAGIAGFSTAMAQEIAGMLGNSARN